MIVGYVVIGKTKMNSNFALIDHRHWADGSSCWANRSVVHWAIALTETSGWPASGKLEARARMTGFGRIQPFQRSARVAI